MPICIGVISDTHGLLRPEALQAPKGSDYIIHAGDVGDPAILKDLSKIAPVTTVRGNVDADGWAQKLPPSQVLQIGETLIYVLHDLKQLDLDARVAGFAAVVTGHTHHPRIEEKDGVLYFNPGSAGPRRFSLPVSVGRIVAQGTQVHAEIINLLL